MRDDRIIGRPSGVGRRAVAKVAFVAAALWLAGCGTGGDGFDYDRAHGDLFAYPFAGGATPAPSGGGIGGRGVAGSGRDALASEVDAARRGAAAGSQAAQTAAAAERQARTLDRVEQRRSDAEVKALEAAGRDVDRLTRETPSPNRSASDIAHDRDAAVIREIEMRRAFEFDAQRRAAGDRRTAAPDLPGPFELGGTLERRTVEGLMGGRPAPLGGRAPRGALPDIGPVTPP